MDDFWVNVLDVLKRCFEDDFGTGVCPLGMDSGVWVYNCLNVICLTVYNMFHIIIIISPGREWPVVPHMGLYLVPHYFCCILMTSVLYRMAYPYLCLWMMPVYWVIIKHIGSLQSCISENLQMASEWLQVNKFSSISKSHYMLLIRKRSDVQDIGILKSKNCELLGVIMDDKLTCNNIHIKKIPKSIAIMF